MAEAAQTRPGSTGNERFCALVVDDDASIRSFISSVVEEYGWTIGEAEDLARATELVSHTRWDIIFLDKQLPDGNGHSLLQSLNERGIHSRVVFITADATPVDSDRALDGGAVDYLPKPFDPADIRGHIDKYIARFGRAGGAGEEASGRKVRSDPSPVENALVGRSKAIIKINMEARRVARTDSPVFVTGATGTGKEVVARLIHRHSPRARKPFVSVNCGALSNELLESELFGHVRGSFTGADRDRAGLLEEANEGTIFLDEISETGQAFQVKLLRALQEGEIRRVGSNRVTKIDVRVIAASNRDIKADVAAGKFREDLYYRLNTCELVIPQLRERREDIIPLIEHFAGRTGRVVTFAPGAVEVLVNYDWPGNVRELENSVRHAVQRCDESGEVQLGDLPERLRASLAGVDRSYDGTNPPAASREDSAGSAGEKGVGPVTAGPPAEAEQVKAGRLDSDASMFDESGRFLTSAELQERHLQKALEMTGGNLKKAAELLGISYRQMRRNAKNSPASRESERGEDGSA